jgi:phenylalanyl-tRNA synthetase beta chain
MKVIHDWLRDYVGDEMPPVIELEQIFTFHAFEIEDIDRVDRHDVIDVKVLPDRSSDCLSHRGIAHELAALIGVPLVKDPLRTPVVLEPKTDKLTVTIEDKNNCRRFTGALIEGVTIKDSPEWLKERLRALGQRSINNVVDATNYVMLSVGQPLHAYDAEKFPHDTSGWHFGVRMAKDGESVTTLTGETYTLTPRVQLITEKNSDIPVGVAGVKGGKYAEIDASTTSLIIEAANFHPEVTRRSSQSLKLITDASKRFENNLPPELAAYGLRDVVALIIELAGGTCEGFIDEYPNPQSNVPVAVTHAHIESLLGLTLPKETIESILSRLGFTVTKTEGGWEVVAPFERTDVLIAEDVIAEVGRVHGYEHVASVVPATVPLQEVNARHYYSEMIRRELKNQGFSEVITSSFRKKDSIELQNALASDKGCLRSNLRENIREALDRNMPNADLLQLRSILVFEIGTVFNKKEGGKGIVEHTALALGVRQKQTGPTPKDDERLKEIVTTIEGVLGVSLKGTLERGVYECNLTEVIATLPLPTSYAPFVSLGDVTFASFSQYPFVSRDIALWTTEGVTESEIATCIKEEGGELLTHITLFDEFHKEGKVSYAFRLVFQSFDKTLTDEEVGVLMSKITDSLTNKGYTVR